MFHTTQWVGWLAHSMCAGLLGVRTGFNSPSRRESISENFVSPLPTNWMGFHLHLTHSRHYWVLYDTEMTFTLPVVPLNNHSFQANELLQKSYILAQWSFYHDNQTQCCHICSRTNIRMNCCLTTHSSMCMSLCSRMKTHSCTCDKLLFCITHNDYHFIMTTRPSVVIFAAERMNCCLTTQSSMCRSLCSSNGTSGWDQGWNPIHVLVTCCYFASHTIWDCAHTNLCSYRQLWARTCEPGTIGTTPQTTPPLKMAQHESEM
jgi:hypothetical protein